MEHEVLKRAAECGRKRWQETYELIYEAAGRGCAGQSPRASAFARNLFLWD